MSIEIPDRFLDVKYNAAHYPGAPGVDGIVGGANCQQYAYEILRYFGRRIPAFRSSDLWEDVKHTRAVFELAPLDLVLFNDTEKSWGAHVGLCISSEEVIHLSRQMGRPAVWRVPEFQKWPQYKVFIGAKRVLRESIF